jgi:hypothetical protein
MVIPDAVHLAGQALVMGRHQRRAALAPNQCQEFGQHTVGRGLVEVAGRFVG